MTSNNNNNNYNYNNIPTPCFVVDEELLIKNLEVLKMVEERTNAHVLLAQKCFSMYDTYPLIRKYISGTTASGLYEAKLGYDKMGGQTHVFSAGYRDDEIDEILQICDHVVFNSFTQWERFKDKAIKAGKEYGIRINPEISTQEGHEIYDPCSPYSRMGVTLDNFRDDLLEGISGLHFHTLCEQNSDDLKTTLKVVEEKFGKYLYNMKWLNFGGGHHITREDYDVETLIECINHMKTKYDLEIFIEPGEAVALNSGFMVSTVLDITRNGKNIAIMDTSAACHMPDVIEMPYTPKIINAKIAEECGESEQSESVECQDKNLLYRLGGPTCLSGDVIGDYIFEKPLTIGDRVIFCDMAIYSMVKTNTFNGMPLPSIAYKKGDKIKLIKTFGYEDFKSRLGS